MAKSILPKDTSTSNPYPYSPSDAFLAQVDFVAEEIQSLMQICTIYPDIKNAQKIKILVKISQEFVKICATQEGV